MVVGAGHPFSGSLSEAFMADCVAVLLCCTAPGVAVKPHGQNCGLKFEGRPRLGLSMLAPQAKLHVQTVPERDRIPVNCSPDCNPGCNFRLLVTPWCCTR